MKFLKSLNKLDWILVVAYVVLILATLHEWQRPDTSLVIMIMAITTLIGGWPTYYLLKKVNRKK